ncbi:hypothetical protein [Pseudanabaena sp. FACHB-2040]|uniref:hypothetical protein n=1 Tax=Pseudanabaena sp. FACHB-2040 TaxID=2692859 RepID=UPI001685ADFD|nr:hypothetical protein [Pseudanabaena sp. FACHB-2040]MBD2261155.1 hypothetical protein [Pseudanabaena sp. FACHB-2040]
MSISGKQLLAVASKIRAVEQCSFRLAKLKAFDLLSALNREATRQDDLPGSSPTLLDRSFPYDSM